jgi:endo-1,3-1,4-beta-glycanase ExoK
MLAVACSDGPLPTASEPGATEDARVSSSAHIDHFDGFDPAFWSREEHPLGRGMFRTQNVRTEAGNLQLVHPAGTYDGGEIRSLQRFGPGVYEARMKTPDLPGSITAFFLYQGVERSDEIDIEIFNDGSRRIMFTTWIAERQTNSVTRVLPFDPADGFNTYRIEWNGNRVRFLVNGRVMQQFTGRVPRNTMYVMANTWWPVWLSGPRPATDTAALFDYVTVAPD